MTMYNRVIINGTGVPGEVWSVGLNYNAVNPIGTFENLQQWAQGIADYIEAQPTTGIYEIISTAAAITEIRTELRGPEEQLVQAAEVPLTPVKTGLGAATKTPQTTVCFSLLTGRPGRSYRGRLYWPAYSWSGTTAMRFTPANLGLWITSLRALNTAIEAQAELAEPTSTLAWAVRSRLLNSNQEIISVAAGDVPDVQRRRRDDLEEVYVTQPLVP